MINLYSLFSTVEIKEEPHKLPSWALCSFCLVVYLSVWIKYEKNRYIWPGDVKYKYLFLIFGLRMANVNKYFLDLGRGWQI